MYVTKYENPKECFPLFDARKNGGMILGEYRH